MNEIVLGEEQIIALERLKDFILHSNTTAISLVGSAGTGKTVLINELLKWIKDSKIRYTLCAPTHKAGLVLRSTTMDDSVTTIHKMLNLTPNLEIFDLDFNELEFLIKDPNKLTIPTHGVVICDEASMINDDLFKTLIHQISIRGSKVIFTGDERQIQPVNARKTSKVFGLDNKIVLTKIYRQSDQNALMPILQKLRDTPINKFKNRIAPEGSLYCFNNTKDFIKEAYKTYKEAINNQDILHTKILAYTNKRVFAYNQCMKKLLFNNSKLEYNKGEFLTAYENISTGDIDCYNSMDYIITNVEQIDIDIPEIGNFPGYKLNLYDSFFKTSGDVNILSRDINSDYYLSIANAIEEIRLEAIRLKRMKRIGLSKRKWVTYFEIMNSFTTPVDLYIGDRLIRSKSFDYGYAISVHKSQGSSLDEIFVDMKNIDICKDQNERRQLQYVALSRTRSNAYILQ